MPDKKTRPNDPTPKNTGDKNTQKTGASIVIATYKNPSTLRKVLQSMQKLDYPKNAFEVIVVNDGSNDTTSAMIEREFTPDRIVRVSHKNAPLPKPQTADAKPFLTLIDFETNQGVCRARNAGIATARFPIVINMDHDCIAAPDWLSKMMAGFDSPNVGVVSAYDYYGGTSTGFPKTLLDNVGGYDESYRYYREDTDLSFKIMDLGYEFKLVKAAYIHDHEEVKPKGPKQFAKHVLKRLEYHQNDVLLWKKHPTPACARFLHVKFGFLIDPRSDFAVATGTWKKNGRFELSSPRGITFLQNKSPLHTLAIILGGIGYVLAVKAYRLAGSLRHKKLLI